MKHTHTRQRMTNNDKLTTMKENKFDTSDNPGLLFYAMTISLKFKLK